MVHVLLLLTCAVVIYLACEWFVNAVEWLGAALRVGPLAVGTILAAAGTALPESVVTLVAVTLGTSDQSKDVGVGAAMGGPLALATIAYGVTGLMILLRRRAARSIAAGESLALADPVPVPALGLESAPDDLHAAGVLDGGEGLDRGDGPDVAGPVLDPDITRRLARDQAWFLAIFVVKVGLGLLAFAYKPWLGLLFFAMYAVYFWQEMRGDGGEAEGEELEPLKLLPRRERPPLWAVLTQTLVTLVVIFAASQLFVGQLEWAGPALGLPAVVVALLLSPIATELPEVMNAIIWVRAGKIRLALANISGAMMIQATVPSGLGLLFTPWRFDAPLLLSGLATMAAIVYLLASMWAGRLSATRLTWAAAFYLLFAVGLFVVV